MLNARELAMLYLFGMVAGAGLAWAVAHSGPASAQGAPECVPPAQLRVVSDQRNQSQDQLAAIVAQANATIERLTKELEAAKAKPKDEVKK